MGRRSKRAQTIDHARWAHKRAKQLGPLKPVVPSRTRSDGSPIASESEVYVTRTGEVFHPAWCTTVGENWDRNPDGLLLIKRESVGSRRECKNCEYPLTGE